MAKSPSLDKLQSLTNEASAVRTVNENYERIESAFENTLSRDGSTPNQMESDLDLNSNRILNLPYPETDTEPFRKGDAAPFIGEVEGLVNEAQDAAQLAGEYKDAAATATAAAQTAQQHATKAENDANRAATEANRSAASAEQSAATAASGAQTATEQAGLATQEANRATTQANNASTSATDAAGSATAAAQERGVVETLRGEVATDRQAVADDRAAIETLRGEVASDRQAVAEDLQAATSARQAAEAAEQAAAGHATQAGLEKDAAVTARQGAEAAQSAAESAQTTAEAKAAATALDAEATAADRLAVATDKTDVATMKTAVEASAAAAATSETNAAASATTAAEHRQAAETAASNAAAQASLAAQEADRATDPATSLQMLLDSANGDGVTAAYDILVRDTLRREAEARSGGRVTVLYDSHGNPNWMHVLPKFRYEDLGYGTEFGTGVCTAFLVDGVEKPEIFIGQYQASGNYAQSIAYADPTTGINYDDAKAACGAKGTGWHLMTAHEWAAVALWCMANGFEPRGNTNWGRAHDATHEIGRRGDGGLPGDSNGTGRTNTGSGPASWYHTGDHTGIADLVGNVWEWQHGLKFVDGQIVCIPDNNYALAESSWLATGHYVSNENSTPTLMNEPGIADETYISQNWDSLGKAAGYTESQLLQRLLISPAGIHPQGRFYIRTAAEHFPYRGGHWNHGGNAGLAALHADNPRSVRPSFIGFRPAYVTP